MHIQMIVYLMFFIFEISAGVTEFPCKFPCPWRNKTFNIYEDGNKVYDISFSGDGQTNIVTLPIFALQQQCYQITERFIITRNKDTDKFQCYGIFYDIESPLKFQFLTRALVEFHNQTGELADICDVCREDGTLYEAVALGAEPTSPPIAKKSIACFVPSTCTSASSTFCNMTDIIPRGCPMTTTESPTTTTEQTTTESTTTKEPTKSTKAHCRRKNHPHTK